MPTERIKLLKVGATHRLTDAEEAFVEATKRVKERDAALNPAPDDAALMAKHLPRAGKNALGFRDDDLLGRAGIGG